MAQAELAAIRFGYGLGRHRPAADAEALLASLRAPDTVAERYPMMDVDSAASLALRWAEVQKAARKGGPKEKEAEKAFKRAHALHERDALRRTIARILDSEIAFRERLVMFWADHFTARPKSNRTSVYVQPYLDSTLRPNVTRRFSDMLKAVAQSPLMLAFLDQNRSIGPGSPVGRKQGRGLNENLAREMLELHTLGVGGAYGQTDVRQLAELLTGLDFRESGGFRFRANFAEPGAEVVLGTAYGGDPAKLADIHAALEALAVHPDTARHVARKLAVHFVSDKPDADLVATMAAAWQATDGDLMAVYAAMLAHPAAWSPELQKVKQPFDFIVSALVALGADGKLAAEAPRRLFFRHVELPMRTMSQRFFRAPGPDGWAEAAEAWVTPQGLATRIRWAQDSPRRLVGTLPDPRDFVEQALGSLAPAQLRGVVQGAETQVQGVGLVLASPTFNRR